MKHSIYMVRGITLLTVSVIFCLGVCTAQGQRSGRLASRATGQVSRAAAGQTSASQAAACPNSSSSQTNSASTTTQSASVSGTIVQSNAASLNTQSGQASGAVSAQRTASNQLLVAWSGNTSNVQQVYLGVLDANGRVIEQRVVTQLPVQASLTLTAAARYYGVQVVYANGASRTMYSPIR